MNDTPSSPERSIEQNLPILAVLGLSSKGDIDWARLRGLQYAALAKLTFNRAYVHALLSVFVAQMYLASAGPIWVGGWIAALAFVHIRGAMVDRRLADADRRPVSISERWQHAATSVFSGLLWAVPLVVFSPLGTVEEAMALLLVVMLLVACSVYFYTTSPISIMIFTAIVGAAGIVQPVLTQQWFVAGAVTLFTLATFLGTVQVARMYLTARLAEDGVAEKEEVVSLLLREFEENEADWLWEIDPQRRLRSVSPRFAFALNMSDRDVEGQPLLELIAGAHWESGNFPASLHDLAERLRNRENFSNLIVQVSIHGADRWWELSGTPIRDERGKFVGFRGVGSDVTEQRESSEKIAYLARYDTLTSLPNRLMLTEALGDALEYAQHWRTRCALLMVDLDRFKAVNDSLGHMTGDKMLAQVSARLESLMSDNAMVGRLGGDEFAIVIRDASDLDVLHNLADKVIKSLSEPYLVDHQTLYVGASVGSAIGPRDGKTVEELMRNADLALYRAKDAGGGEHCRFEPVLHASAEERRQLEASLRKALGLDEFVLHYQPVVDARTEEVVSFEALVRWNSSDHGFVSPGKFIPLAEDTRLIVPIGKWVLRQACHEARNWPEDVKVNVNVSPEQLLEPDFHQEVVDALAASGLRPERLEIEVTESIFLRDATIARNALEQAMALGCSIALDDFGTGYSSLGYLRKLRFSTIKVDRSFVQGAGQGSNESLAIINAVVAMAKSMNMTTTAEGVEDADEAELIRNLGCDKIQGFYFGRPMSSEEALRLFSNGKAALRKIA
ncbi:EAL domain-containing protein [Erythrobacter sp. Alg231-14]|uniref:EAL domain-containing protein n=1 Tax=Erythrobacter sp. Alg231-14 TaxID=1922225 RepID=UPI000D555243